MNSIRSLCSNTEAEGKLTPRHEESTRTRGNRAPFRRNAVGFFVLLLSLGFGGKEPERVKIKRWRWNRSGYSALVCKIETWENATKTRRHKDSRRNATSFFVILRVFGSWWQRSLPFGLHCTYHLLIRIQRSRGDSAGNGLRDREEVRRKSVPSFEGTLRKPARVGAADFTKHPNLFHQTEDCYCFTNTRFITLPLLAFMPVICFFALRMKSILPIHHAPAWKPSALTGLSLKSSCRG
jgi:hypothetical protein